MPGKFNQYTPPSGPICLHTRTHQEGRLPGSDEAPERGDPGRDGVLGGLLGEAAALGEVARVAPEVVRLEVLDLLEEALGDALLQAQSSRRTSRENSAQSSCSRKDRSATAARPWRSVVSAMMSAGER
jgi:hypothetical protein